MNALKLICRNALHSKCASSYMVQNRTLCYKSALSLENIYPESSLAITTPKTPPHDPSCPDFSGYIPLDQLQVTYSRSSGPGGQHVNTVNTKVDLRFHILSASWLKEDIRKKLTEQYRTKISNEGFLIIRSEKTRSQQVNLADALQQLRTMIRAVAIPPKEPKPETEEMIRRRREKSARLRLVEKRMRSVTKQQRQAPEVDF